LKALTREADRDITRILAATLRLFGPNQVRRYAEIIKRAMSMIEQDPDGVSSQPREDLSHGVRSLHLQLVAGRHGGAAHVVCYRIALDSESRTELIVLRVLADEMEP
jgi:toxin ParE1/3/4